MGPILVPYRARYGAQLEFHQSLMCKKTKPHKLSRNWLMVRSTVSKNKRPVCDRRTDGHRPIAHTALCVCFACASRGKNSGPYINNLINLRIAFPHTHIHRDPRHIQDIQASFHIRFAPSDQLTDCQPASWSTQSLSRQSSVI